MDRSTEKLESVYYDPNSPGSFGSIKKLYDSVKDKGFKYKQVENWLNKQNTYNLFRKSIKNFPRLPILVDKIDEQWQADLMDMTWVSRENDNFKYILVIIDCLSRYALTNESKARQNILEAQPINKKKQVPYEINDFVRITRAKALFEKGATSNWTEELFKITKVKHTPQGYVYRLADWSNEPITSIFYHDEIFPVDEPGLYKIERIIKTKTNPITKKKEYFVKWLGYPDKFNSWVQDVE